MAYDFMNSDLMKRIAKRDKLAKRLGLEFIDGPWPFLKVDTWPGVARVVGEAKREPGKTRVFVRGQIDNYRAMAPSLFRGDTSDTASLFAAEEEFGRRLGEQIPVARFQAPNPGALLQHYGFRTSWLDVLDNLFVAYWFAAHRINEGSDGTMQVCESAAKVGWLFLIRPPADASIVDLRVEHHPLSARPHVQHGVSLRLKGEGVGDLAESVVATIQTPVAGSVAGSLFTGAALFPHDSEDHTLKLLLKRKANDLAASVEHANHLKHGVLGRISRWPNTA